MFFEGYKYWMAYTKNKITYYRCMRCRPPADSTSTSSMRTNNSPPPKSQRCPGRCSRDRFGLLKQTRAHSHEPEDDVRLVDAFRKVLTQRAAHEHSVALHEIYWDEASQRHLEAAMLYPFDVAETTMRKARMRRQQLLETQRRNQLKRDQEAATSAKTIDDEQRTVEDIDAALSNVGADQWFWVGTTKPTSNTEAEPSTSPSSFYRTTLKLPGGVKCWMFAHLETLQRLGGPVDCVHVDASVLADEGSADALLPGIGVMVFHAVQTNRSTPIVYAVMASHSTTPATVVYAAVFEYVRENFAAEIRPTLLITNYDSDMFKAAAYAYPDATVKGFWHEYTVDLLARVRQPPSLRTDSFVIATPTNSTQLQRETATGHGCSYLRMLMVLPLLPADYMTPGLEAVRRWAMDKQLSSDAMQSLCTHVSTHWLRPWGAGKMSVFGVPQAVVGQVGPAQKFGRRLRDLLQNDGDIVRATNADITNANATATELWKLLKTITRMAQQAWVDVRRSKKVGGSSNAGNRNEKLRRTILADATEQWIRTPVHLRNPLQFLQLTSHCANELLYNAQCVAANAKAALEMAAAAAATAQHQRLSQHQLMSTVDVVAVETAGSCPSELHHPQQLIMTPMSDLMDTADSADGDGNNVGHDDTCTFDELLRNDHNYFFDTTTTSAPTPLPPSIIWHLNTQPPTSQHQNQLSPLASLTGEPFTLATTATTTSSSSTSSTAIATTYSNHPVAGPLYGTQQMFTHGIQPPSPMLSAPIVTVASTTTSTTVLQCSGNYGGLHQQSPELLQPLTSIVTASSNPPPRPFKHIQPAIVPPPLLSLDARSSMQALKPTSSGASVRFAGPPPLKFYASGPNAAPTTSVTVRSGGPPPLVLLGRRTSRR